MHTVVERQLELSLVLSPELSLPVPARLTYGTHDPYAVHITFHVGTDAPIRWAFARELLLEGLFRPCGLGDVRVWPTNPGKRGFVCVSLASPDGEALLKAPASAVSAWLEQTLRLVAPGSEYEWLAMDDALDRLLTSAGPNGPSPGDPWTAEEPPKAGS
jgi:hypothetical protein